LGKVTESGKCLPEVSGCGERSERYKVRAYDGKKLIRGRMAIFMMWEVGPIGLAENSPGGERGVLF